jgi:hypothetical protein
MRQSILLAFSLCLLFNSYAISGAAVETVQVQQVNFSIEQLWNNVNKFLDPKTNDFGSLFKVFFNGSLPNLNDFEKFVKPENLKVFNDTKKAVEIAKAILGLNVNSLGELLLANKNQDLNSVFKTLVNNTLPNLNEFQKFLNPGTAKIFNETRQCLEIAKQILGLNSLNSYSELAKAVATLPKDPVSLGLRIAQVVFAKELKAADQEVVKRLTTAINNIQDPNLRTVVKFVAQHPYTEKVFGKDVTTEPVTRLVYFLARLV